MIPQRAAGCHPGLAAAALLLALGVGACAGGASRAGPSPFEAAVARGWEDMREDRHREAAAAFGDAASRAGTLDELSRALLGRAEALERAGRFEAAHRAWTEAARRLSGHRAAVRAAYHAAVVEEEHLDRLESAMKTYERIVRQAPGSVQASRALRRLAAASPAGASRLELYRELYRDLASTPIGPLLLLECGDEARQRGLPVAALVCYRRLVRAHPSSALVDDALFQAAGIYADLERGREAVHLLQRIVLARPSPDPGGPFPSPLREGALLTLGDVEAGLRGRPRAARAAWRRLIYESPESLRVDDAWYRLARLARAQGRTDAARRAFAHMLEANPTSRHRDEAESLLR